LPGVDRNAVLEGTSSTEIRDLHRWPPSRRFHAEALVKLVRFHKVRNIQMKVSDFRSPCRRLFLRTRFIGSENFFEIQCKGPGPFASISTDEDKSITSTGLDTAKSFRRLQGELDINAVRIIQINRFREGVVGRGHGIPQVDKPLEHSSEVSLIRRVDGDVVKAAVSLQVRCSRAAMQHKECLIRSPDLDAAATTRAPLKTGKLLPKPGRPFRVSDLKMNWTKRDEILMYHIDSLLHLLC